MIVGVGVDLVAVGRVRGLVERWGERFTGRLFTPAELAYAMAKADPAVHLAARVAAKEATFKSLSLFLADAAAGWREVELVARAGRPSVQLSPRLAGMIPPAGIHVSLSHDGGFAIAFVVVETADD